MTTLSFEYLDIPVLFFGFIVAAVVAWLCSAPTGNPPCVPKGPPLAPNSPPRPWWYGDPVPIDREPTATPAPPTKKYV